MHKPGNHRAENQSDVFIATVLISQKNTLRLSVKLHFRHHFFSHPEPLKNPRSRGNLRTKSETDCELCSKTLLSGKEMCFGNGVCVCVCCGMEWEVSLFETNVKGMTDKKCHEKKRKKWWERRRAKEYLMWEDRKKMFHLGKEERVFCGGLGHSGRKGCCLCFIGKRDFCWKREENTDWKIRVQFCLFFQCVFEKNGMKKGSREKTGPWQKGPGVWGKDVPGKNGGPGRERVFLGMCEKNVKKEEEEEENSSGGGIRGFWKWKKGCSHTSLKKCSKQQKEYNWYQKEMNKQMDLNVLNSKKYFSKKSDMQLGIWRKTKIHL